VDSTGEGATGVGSGSAAGATGVTSTSGSTAFAAATYAGLGPAARSPAAPARSSS